MDQFTIVHTEELGQLGRPPPTKLEISDLGLGRGDADQAGAIVEAGRRGEVVSSSREVGRDSCEGCASRERTAPFGLDRCSREFTIKWER